MSHRIRTLLLLSLFVATSANSAWACGGHHCGADTKSPPHRSKESCGQEADNVASACADHSANPHQHTGSKCPCHHGHGGCHCPGCGTTGCSSAAFALASANLLSLPTSNASVQKRAFYFADHLPEAVYLPIWQPPKLGV